MRLRDIDPDIIEGGCALGFVYDLLEQVEGIEDLYSRVRTDASYRTYSSEIRQYLGSTSSPRSYEAALTQSSSARIAS